MIQISRSRALILLLVFPAVLFVLLRPLLRKDISAHQNLSYWQEASHTDKSQSISLPKLHSYAHSHLESLVEHVDLNSLTDQYGLLLTTTSLSIYTSDLFDTYRTYFEETYRPSWLDNLIPRLHLFPFPLEGGGKGEIGEWKSKKGPRRIMTITKQAGVVPGNFARYTHLMSEWEQVGFGDSAMERWIGERFGGRDVERIWKDLPLSILRTDLFRYLYMLVEGGLYVDTDTAPVTHLDEWGIPHIDRTDHFLRSIPSLVGLSKGKTRNIDHDFPALIISIDSDPLAFGQSDWRATGVDRAVQIAQWTFFARPGHPVLLDTLSRVLKTSKELERVVLRMDENGKTVLPIQPSEWSGTGPFSDAVYQYLLVRYGFHPDHLVNQRQPVRVGDVLILPAGSFAAENPFEEVQQRPYAAIWHAFQGRLKASDLPTEEFG